ncbi:MAG: RES family NAD+ phosphorylase [Chloroflexi bacterium]|nr:RES family NAD+ phosphorylase [Chloroflexota bacterium]
MTLDSFLRPWSGSAVRHIPAGSRYEVLDFRFAGRGADNRWNYPGEPTLYLASDRGVALAEFARHLKEDRAPDLSRAAVERQVFRLELAIDRLLDLRDPHLCQLLGLEGTPVSFLDKVVARATANYLRRVTAAQALLVPLMAFLDHLDRWVMVLFLEKLPPEPRRFIPSMTVEGRLRVG